MPDKKLFHPSVHIVRMEEKEIKPEDLELAAVILHELGWMTQQGAFENAVNNLRLISEQEPDGFLRACAAGLAVLRFALG